MKVSDQFNLPLKAIMEGTRVFEFRLGEDFFQAAENKLIGSCEIRQKVTLEKRADLMILSFWHEGYMLTDCDRCLEEIKLPLEGNKTFILKYADQPLEEEEDVIYLLPESDHFDLSPLINEVVTLSLPLVKTYACEQDPAAPCNPEVLKYLEKRENDDDISPVWDELKNLKLGD